MQALIGRTCTTHAYFSLITGILLYFRPLDEAIVLMGVQHETSHSLRNTGFLLFLTSYLSFCVGNGFMRRLPQLIGGIFGFKSETDSFVAGLVIAVNSCLLVHYSFEAFCHHAIAKTSITILWILTFGAILGINFAIKFDGDNAFRRPT